MKIKISTIQERILRNEKNFEISLIVNNYFKIINNEFYLYEITNDHFLELYDYCVCSDEPAIIKLANLMLKLDKNNLIKPYKYNY